MKTILNIKHDNKLIQVPANYLFSDTGVHFFIHRQVLQVYANGSIEYSEKCWSVCEYKTGVVLKRALAKKSAKGECMDELNKHGIQKAVELLNKHEAINFDIDQVLSFANKQVPLPAKNLVLGKYFIDNDVIAEAEKTFNTERRNYKFSTILSEARNWIKLANELVMLPGYTATLGKCAKNNWDMIVIKHDKGSYQFPLESDILELRKALLQAFNVDGLGEHLRAEPVPKVKKGKAVKVIPAKVEVVQVHVQFTEPAPAATWINKNGISIELPDDPMQENSSGITYDPPMQENRMYVDKAGVLWEFTPVWLINENISTHNKKPKEHEQDTEISSSQPAYRPIITVYRTSANDVQADVLAQKPGCNNRRCRDEHGRVKD